MRSTINKQRISSELLKVARELVASDVMIAEAIMNILLGNKRAASKLIQLTTDFRADLPDEDEGRLAFWDETFGGVMRALRKTDLVKIIGKRMIGFWAEAIANVVIHESKVPARLQQKTIELIINSGADSAQLGRDVSAALLKEVKGSFEIVKMASKKTAKTDEEKLAWGLDFLGGKLKAMAEDVKSGDADALDARGAMRELKRVEKYIETMSRSMYYA